MRGRLGMMAAVVMTAGAAHAQGDTDQGMVVFLANCAACHSIEPGEHKAGPSLAGVFRRTAGSLEGFQFSSALTAESFEWNDATLFEYLTVPTQRGGGDEGLVHGVAMGFEGIETQSAEDLIAFLKRL
jgi:cytochrome c